MSPTNALSVVHTTSHSQAIMRSQIRSYLCHKVLFPMRLRALLTVWISMWITCEYLIFLHVLTFGFMAYSFLNLPL